MTESMQTLPFDHRIPSHKCQQPSTGCCPVVSEAGSRYLLWVLLLLLWLLLQHAQLLLQLPLHLLFLLQLAHQLRATDLATGGAVGCG